MDTKKLAALAAAVRLGSFTRAAEELGYTQSGLTHMMNSNTFTCGAFQLKDGVDAAALAKKVEQNIQSRQWMCGFPDKLVIVTLDQYVISMYGHEDLINTFRDKLQAAYSSAAIAYDEAIL